MALGLVIDFTANIARFSSQVDRIAGDLGRFQQRAETMSQRVSKAFGAIGVGLSVAGLVSFAKAGIDALDNLNDLSLKTGVAVEALAGFDLVAKQSGTSLESVGTAINKLSKNIAANREEFTKLGISAKDPTEAFLQFADTFNSIQNAQDKAAFGAKALGKSYADMAPLLSLGSAELRRLVTEGQAASHATTALAQEADKFNDTLELMKARIGGIATIAGGSFASAFNNLVDSISNATSAGVSFNNVMAGIGNAFAHKDSFSGVAGQLDRVNQQISVTEKKVNALKNNGIIGGLLDDLVGNDVNLEKNRLDGLYKAQEKLANQLKTETSSPLVAPKVNAPDSAALNKFIGAGGSGSRSGAGSAHKAAKTAVDQLQQSYQAMLASLQKEIALRDQNGEAAKLEYELINGNLKGLAPAQAANLVALAKEKDALERQDKQWAALIDSANEYYDLRQSNAELIRSGDIQSGFNEALARTQDQLKAGNINADQAKAEFDKLGQAWNDEYITPAKEGQDKLSEYAIQGARNMESAFADFLFDPFNTSIGGLVENFSAAMRRMAANYLSSKLFELIKEGFNDTGSTSSSSAVSSGVSVLGALGNYFSSSGSGGYGGFSSGASAAGSAYLSSGFTYAANGKVFAGSNIIPFARGGGIVTAPAKFPMPGGKTGLMGEAGPEAIMPLMRTPSGQLGVSVYGDSGSVIIPVGRGPDGKLGVTFKDSAMTRFAAGGMFDKAMALPVKATAGGGSVYKPGAPPSGRAVNITVNVQGSNNAPDVRRAAGQGAREALAMLNGASRYG